MALTPCRFSFDIGPTWDGFNLRSQWNGFDNVAVTHAVAQQIADWLGESEDGFEARDCLEEIIENTPATELVSLADGYATQIEKEAPVITTERNMSLAIETFKPGQRVVTTGHVDNFPVIIVRPGEVGTVDEVVQEGDFLRIMVAMDHHFTELTEWDNCLEVTVYPNDEAPLAVVEDRDPVPVSPLCGDSPSCAVALAEAVSYLAGEIGRKPPGIEQDRLLAVLGTLQAILMQKGCAHMTESEKDRLTDVMDEAIFG